MLYAILNRNQRPISNRVLVAIQNCEDYFEWRVIMKYKAGEKRHGSKTHDRWIEKTERVSANPDATWEKQCFNCQYYMYLSGPLRDDWGVCSNPESPFDATLRFEHDGCIDQLLIED